jgi:hypothetical protein
MSQEGCEKLTFNLHLAAVTLAIRGVPPRWTIRFTN